MVEQSAPQPLRWYPLVSQSGAHSACKRHAVKTFAGDGKPGSGDESPRFYQPGGLSVAGESLYVADTNNHKIRVIDIQSGAVRTLEIAGLNAPRSEKVSAIQAD